MQLAVHRPCNSDSEENVVCMIMTAGLESDRDVDDDRAILSRHVICVARTSQPLKRHRDIDQDDPSSTKFSFHDPFLASLRRISTLSTANFILDLS